MAREVGLSAAILFFTPCLAWANFAPIAVAGCEVGEAAVGQPLRFSSGGSVDPDDAPRPMSFSWTFSDGATSMVPSPTHTFATAGAQRATLTVSDGADTAIASVVVQVLSPPTPGRPASSGPLALTPDGKLLVVVNPDSQSVTWVDAMSLTVTREVKLGHSPIALAYSPTASTAFVAVQSTDELWSVSSSGEAALVAHTAHGPVAVAVVPSSGEVLVAAYDSGVVQLFDPSGRELLATIGVGPEPRALAVDSTGARLYVTHFLSRGTAGSMSIVDLATRKVISQPSLAEDPGPDTPSSGRGVPNLLGAIAVEASGDAVWAGGLKSNSASGPLRDGRPLASSNWVRGVAVRLVAATGEEQAGRRIDTNDADSVSAIAFSPNGRWGYFAHAGLGALSVYDLPAAAQFRPGDGASAPFAVRIDIGDLPSGIAVAPDGRRAYVAALLSREIVEVDVSTPTAAQVVRRVVVTGEPLSASLLDGKRQFFSSRPPLHSKDGYVACASCHPEGGSDGRTWDTTQKGEGVRNTRDLRGRGGMGDGPLHWSANFDEDFERDIVTQLGGTGLAQDGKPPNPPLGESNAGRSAALDHLALFVSSLTQVPPSPFRDAAGFLTPAALRGRDAFQVAGCPKCHPPPLYTDSTLTAETSSYVLHDIGTLTPASGSRLGGPLNGLDTPSLLGLWASAPYLHDGTAATLSDALRRPGTMKARLTEALSQAELEDLVEFLLELDGRQDEPAVTTNPDVRACGCGAAGLETICFLLFTLLTRRRGHR